MSRACLHNRLAQVESAKLLWALTYEVSPFPKCLLGGFRFGTTLATTRRSDRSRHALSFCRRAERRGIAADCKGFWRRFRQSQFILVGSPRRITLRGSHRSGRADFPHPALRSTVSLRDVRRTDARLWQWITLQEPKHFLPRECPLRTAAQPLPPHSDDTEAEANQGVAVSGNTEYAKCPASFCLSASHWSRTG